MTTLGWIQGDFDYDWVKSKNTLEKAIQLNPNYSIAHLYYGNLLQYTGENTDRGIKEIEKAVDLDPLSGSLNYVLGRNYWLAKKNDFAFQQLKKALILDPKNNLAKGTLVFVLLAKKNYLEAFEKIKEIPAKGTNKNIEYQGPFLCYAYGITGDTVRAKKELEKTLKDYPDQSPYHLSRAYIILKDYGKALTLLEQAYNMRDIRMHFLRNDPTLDPIRNEPRFKTLLKKTGLAKRQT